MSKTLPASDSISLFEELNINQLIINSLQQLGYVNPTPIQAQIIPHLCDGQDVIGQAQTGTGKTAAFALPILDKLDNDIYTSNGLPQALILAPTRELAIQVADAFRKYAKYMNGVSVTTICGGQEYRPQINELRNGTDIVVGTPGRVIDHIKRGSLDISNIKHFVLDEADEMLRMGFIEDVDWILEHAPENRQIALFSATMPKAIKNIALKYLKNPIKITIEPKKETSKLIEQSYIQVNFPEKMKTLIKILDIHKYDGINGVIVFARTKFDTIKICEELLAHGFRAVALNGDIDQKQRERTISDLKQARIDILIATDVAARGLDVDRITHVINFDMPHDTETYMHRIGRTGRAGKAGHAISFVTKGERGRLRDIERYIKASIDKYQMPSLEAINSNRVGIFEAKVLKLLEKYQNSINTKMEMDEIIKVLVTLSEKTEFNGYEIAAAIVKLLYAKSPLLMTEKDLELASFDDKEKSGHKRSRSQRSGDRSDKRSDRRSGRRSNDRSNDRAGSRSNSRRDSKKSKSNNKDKNKRSNSKRRVTRDN